MAKFHNTPQRPRHSSTVFSMILASDIAEKSSEKVSANHQEQKQCRGTDVKGHPNFAARYKLSQRS